MLTAAQRKQTASGHFTHPQVQALDRLLTNVPGVLYRAAPLSVANPSGVQQNVLSFTVDGPNCITGVIFRIKMGGQYIAPTSGSGDFQPRMFVTGVNGNSGLQPFPHLAPLASAGGLPQAWRLESHIYIQPVVATTVAPSLQSNLSGQPFYPQSNAGVFTTEMAVNISNQTNASAASNNIGGQQDPTLSLLYKTNNPVPIQLGQTLGIEFDFQVRGVKFTLDYGYCEAL